MSPCRVLGRRAAPPLLARSGPELRVWSTFQESQRTWPWHASGADTAAKGGLGYWNSLRYHSFFS